MKYQITLFCTTNEYKPVSCIIEKAQAEDLTNKAIKQALVKQGIIKICSKRYWTQKDLQRYNYKKAKVREYDEEKILQEKIARYEAIKEAKYESGEWKRPKNKK